MSSQKVINIIMHINGLYKLYSLQLLTSTIRYQFFKQTFIKY